MELPPSLTAALLSSQARVRFDLHWWLRPFLLRGVKGFTMGRRIYIAAAVKPDQLERFVRHELEHVRQIGRLGIFVFYWRYVVEYIRHRRSGLAHHGAYRAISFETEARAAEKTYNSPTAAG